MKEVLLHYLLNLSQRSYTLVVFEFYCNFINFEILDDQQSAQKTRVGSLLLCGHVYKNPGYAGNLYFYQIKASRRADGASLIGEFVKEFIFLS